MTVLRQLGKRVAVAVATMLAVSILIFVGVEALPGDAAGAALGQRATPELLAQTRAEFGLDRPIVERYLSWLGGAVTGDLGKSMPTRAPVWELVKDKLRNTATLAFAVILFLVPLSIILGVGSAFYRDRPADHATATTTLALTSTPEFVVGTLLIVLFSFVLGVLPAVSILNATEPISSQLNLVILPCLTLVLVSVAQATRMIRATTIDVLRSDYVRAAILRGTPTGLLLRRHVFPNAIGPTIQIFALTIAWLAGGVVVTEAVFQYPGIGLALTNAVQNRDLPTVEAIAIMVCAVYVFANLAADAAVIALNPRLRRGKP